MLTGKHLDYVESRYAADTDFSAMTWGATLIVPQAVEWGITTTHSATSMNYGILLQGFGGILAVPFIEAYGRYSPVWRSFAQTH